MTGCPDANEVVRILDGEDLEPEAALAFDAHLGACDDCRSLVASLGQTFEPGAAAGSDGFAEPWELVSGAEIVAHGAQIDRYVVLEAIGAGAMGVVYRAYDPDLDRDVALKLVRVLDGRTEGERARVRLLREAQAMARLAHPNVVAVYDASVVGANVFLAMELVGGRDLESVLASGTVGRGPGGWRAIVRLFVEAGRGLAAAHAAGIVHRDFKPSNVLVGDDGRVRVTDFGLAAGEGTPTGAAYDGDRDSRLTDPETLIGTPAYMSPEVRDGRLADARSDQYSFAIALCEAVTGERGAGAAQLPAQLRRPVARALATSPAQRYPSMSALVDALERARIPPLRRALPFVAVGLVAVAAGTGYLVATGEHDRVRCDPPTAQLAGLWDGARAADVRGAFLATKHPLAAAHWPVVAGALDRATRRWSASHVAACEATHVRHERSEAMLDRRMRCLHAERIRLAAVVDMLAHPDREVVTRALDATELEGRIARCEDPDLGATTSTATHDDASMRALAETETSLVRARYAEAAKAAEQLAQRARVRAEPRLEAEATRLLAEARWRGGDPAAAEPILYRTLDLAKQAGAPDIEADALLQLIAVIGFEAGRRAEGLQLARLAEATVRATHDDGRLARVLANRAAVAFAQADYAAARTDWNTALATFERLYGPRDRRVGMTLMNLGNLAATSGEGDALALYDRAEAILAAALSPAHPEVARVLAMRAMSLARVDRFDEAGRDVDRARAIYLEVLGPEHVDVARQLLARASIEVQRGDFAAALVQYRAALAGFERSTPATSPLRPFALAGIGRALVELGRLDEARAPLEEVVARWTDGPVTTDRANAELALARVLWAEGRDRGRALALARHAATTYDAGVKARAEAFLRGKRDPR